MLKSIKSDTKFGNFPRKAYQRCSYFRQFIHQIFKKEGESRPLLKQNGKLYERFAGILSSSKMKLD